MSTHKEAWWCIGDCVLGPVEFEPPVGTLGNWGFLEVI